MMKPAFFAAAILAAGIAFAAAAPTAPNVLEAKNGNVTFNHSTHGAVACDKCHATPEGGKLDLNKDTGHKLCIDCHKAEGKGPAKCAECHKKA